MTSTNHKTLHILFFPLMAPGHLLPMLDMAKLFATRNMITTTILTTPSNSPLIQPSITHFNNSHPHSTIHLHLIPFPPSPGLPEACENLSSIPSQSLQPIFFNALFSLQQPFHQSLIDLRPDCVVTDSFFPWTYNIAAEFDIPRLVFNGSNFFFGCAFDSITRYKPVDSLPADAESFVIPALPHRIEMRRTQIPDIRTIDPVFPKILGQAMESDPKSFGIVVNSFFELEPDYVRHYKSVVGSRAWHVGPVSLCNEDVVDKSTRGNAASIDCEACLDWLGSKKPRSVVYVCFGSLCDFSGDQLREIALGLEVANCSFIWVVRMDGEGEWMPKGYEERVEGRGLVIRGWAPQILILKHEAVGGFVTHCGWNSSLEGVSSGLPMVTWPLFAEQFYNERLIVDVLKIGVAVGVKKYAVKHEEREVVAAEEIEKAVSRMMDGGEEAEERRRRAKVLGEMGRRAVEKDGSSYEDMSNLIQELIMARKPRPDAIPVMYCGA